MADGASMRLWSMDDIVALVGAGTEAAPTEGVPYAQSCHLIGAIVWQGVRHHFDVQ